MSFFLQIVVQTPLIETELPMIKFLEKLAFMVKYFPFSSLIDKIVPKVSNDSCKHIISFIF